MLGHFHVIFRDRFGFDDPHPYSAIKCFDSVETMASLCANRSS